MKPITATALTASSLIALIAVIAAPNLFEAMERGRLKRTLSALRTIGSACEAYAVDNEYVYPQANDIEELAQHVVPTYVKELPRNDAWGTPYDFRTWRILDGALVAGAPDAYGVRSAGRDRVWQHAEFVDYRPGAWESPDDNDLVFAGITHRGY